MHIIATREDLHEALSHAGKVIEARNTIPILSNIRLDAQGEALRITGTDLDCELVLTCRAEVKGPGRTTLPAHTLRDIVGKLAAGVMVSIETTEKSASLRAGRARFTLPTLPDSDFPDMSAGDPAATFSLEAAHLHALLERTRFAISTEETRYYLNGIYLHVASPEDGARLRAVSTDGHRLALHEIAAPPQSEGAPGIIVPRKTVETVLHLLRGEKDPVSISISDGKIRFDMAGNTVLTSKVIDGTFPDYARVIPKDNPHILRVGRALLAESAARVGAISSERGRAVKLAMADDLLTLSVTNPDSGSASEEIEAQWSAPKLETGFNAKYVGELCAAFGEAETLTIALDAPGSPSLWKDPADPAFLAVLMPMRV